MDLARRRFLQQLLLLSGGIGSALFLDACTGGSSDTASSSTPNATPATTGNANPADASVRLDYGRLDPRNAQNFATPLRQPQDSGLLAFLDTADHPIELSARPGAAQLFGQARTPLLAYQTQVQGKPYQNPILRAATGGQINIRFQNQLGDPSIIHWHGMLLDWRQDGNPLYAVNAGGSYDYGFTVANRAGTYWYHPHPHGLSGPQSFHGLSSFLLVDDADETALRQALDLRLGDTDMPLLIQDKRLDDQGKLVYAPSGMEKMMGYLGNVVLVNFTPTPALDADTRLYRFRVLNGSTARMYKLALTQAGNKQDFHLIGTDGGLLDKPYTVQELFLSPAERADILVDLRGHAPGDMLMLQSLAFDPMENEGMGNMGGMNSGGMQTATLGAPLANGEAFNLLKLQVRKRVDYSPTLPATLSRIPPIDTSGAPSRRLTLSLMQMKWLINGQSYQMDAFPVTVARNSTEIWEIVNDPMSMPHPMHLHGVQFQVLSRQGSPAQVSALALDGNGRMASDMGLRDTITVWPGETVRLAVDFANPFSGDQNYLFHCHNLEHEDSGMMINYKLV